MMKIDVDTDPLPFVIGIPARPRGPVEVPPPWATSHDMMYHDIEEN